MALATANTASQDIYTLVLNLSNAERIAIDKLSSATSVGRGRALHMKLYDAIVHAGAQEDVAAQKVLGMKSGAQFSNLKAQLNSEVIDLLTFITRSHSNASRLLFGIMQLETLILRRQYAIARRLYKKLWAAAEDSGCYAVALQLLNCGEKIIDHNSYKRYVAEAEEQSKLIDLYTIYERTEQDICRISTKLARLKADTPLRLQSQQLYAVQVIKDELLSLEKLAAQTPHLHFSYLTALSNAAYLLQEFDLCEEVCKIALPLLECEPTLTDTHPDEFLDLAGTAFYAAFAKNDVGRAKELLDIVAEAATTLPFTDDYRARWEIIRFNTALKIAHKTANYEDVAEQLQGRKQIIEHALRVLPITDALSIMTSICISLFVLDDWSKAEELLIKIKEINRELEREDILYFSLVFHLLILYEQRDWYRLDSATEAAYHVLYSRKKLRPFEQELMRFLKQLPVHRSKGTSANAIRSFLDRLDTFRSDPVQRLYFLYFNYYDWLQSKLAGITYREYRRQQIDGSAIIPGSGG